MTHHFKNIIESDTVSRGARLAFGRARSARRSVVDASLDCYGREKAQLNNLNLQKERYTAHSATLEMQGEWRDMRDH